MAKPEWELIDDTGKRAGYIRLTRHGQRVVDFFPFAKDVDESWVRAQAQLILRTMNGEIVRVPAEQSTS